MSVPWKYIGSRARLSPMGWAVLVLVLVCIASTVIIGIGLFDITGQPTQFNTR